MSKILHMLPTYDTGGLGTLALSLIKFWPDRTAVHEAFATHYPNSKPTLGPEFWKHCKSVYSVKHTGPGMEQMKYVSEIQHVLFPASEYSAVILYNFTDAVWYPCALRRAGFKGRIICHVGTVLPVHNQKDKRPVSIATNPYLGSNIWIPASSAVRAALEVIALPGSIGNTVWNGVDLSLYESPVIRTNPDVVVGFVGRLAPGAKDFEQLIRAVGLCSQNVKLKIAGDGPLLSQFQKLADEVAPGRVRFVGNLSGAQMPEFLHSLDVFAMAALPIEGMSIALVEAIAAGLPIVATDAPACVEVLDSGAGGVIVGCGNVTELADALEGCVDPVARLRLAQRSMARRHLFSVQKMADQYHALT